MTLQEGLAFAVVGLAAGSLTWKAFRATLARPFARRLLRGGRVKWAMKLNAKATDESGCGSGCGSGPDKKPGCH